MELYDFNRQNPEQKTAYIWQQGEFLTVRVEGHCSICLYHMGKFFAEIWYRAADNEIESIRSFKSSTGLEPYLNLVDLSEIIT